MELLLFGLAALLMLVSTFFFIVSGIGLVRMPDLYMRMSATSKAATLGAACAFLAGALYFYDNPSVALRVFAGILFIFATAPIGAHMIGRASYERGIAVWEGAVIDEMADCYDRSTLSFHSSPQRNQTASPQLDESGAATQAPAVTGRQTAP